MALTTWLRYICRAKATKGGYSAAPGNRYGSCGGRISQPQLFLHGGVGHGHIRTALTDEARADFCAGPVHGHGIFEHRIFGRRRAWGLSDAMADGFRRDGSGLHVGCAAGRSDSDRSGIAQKAPHQTDLTHRARRFAHPDRATSFEQPFLAARASGDRHNHAIATAAMYAPGPWPFAERKKA